MAMGCGLNLTRSKADQGATIAGALSRSTVEKGVASVAESLGTQPTLAVVET